jgi:hypothetical protein
MSKAPRDFLCDTDLIGFVPAKSGSQGARRASSAKITEPDDPAKVAASALARAKSDK